MSQALLLQPFFHLIFSVDEISTPYVKGNSITLLRFFQYQMIFWNVIWRKKVTTNQ
jgi:hypothetical protein